MVGFVCCLVSSVHYSAKWRNIGHLKLILILWVFGVYLCCISGSDSCCPVDGLLQFCLVFSTNFF